jgi:biotin carboxylase
MTDGRTLLVVSGGIESVPGIERARAMGLHVVVSDGSVKAPGLAAGDDRLLVSTYDVAATVAAARRYHQTVRPLDGVICIASDVPVTVAAVADALGLPGISMDTARLATHKLSMKERFSECGVPVPWFAPVGSQPELRELVRRRGLPLVLKPVDSRGARGVLLLEDGTDLDWAFATSCAQSPSGSLVIEEFLSGPQLSTESIVLDGVAHTVGLADRNYGQLRRFAPYVIEDGGELPTRLSQDEVWRAVELVQAAAEALGVRTGVVKGDIVISGGRPQVIEIATRLSGGYLCTHEIPLSTGVDFVGAAIRVALGDSLDAGELEPRYRRGVAQRWMFPTPGIVTSIEGVDEVRARPEIALLEVRTRTGDRIGRVDSHPSRAGVAIATGETREGAIEAAERAVAGVRIETAG